MTVHVTTTDITGGCSYPDATGWELREDGSLDVLTGRALVATHAPGRWHAVQRITDPKPDPKPEEPATKEDERPKLTAGSHLADSSRAGRRPEPDTTTFGFSRRYW